MFGLVNEKRYRDRSQLVDTRIFRFGEIWLVEDSLISIPDGDYTEHPGRNLHSIRPVMIVQNNQNNVDPFSHTISIAPLSSKVEYKQRFDVLLTSARDGVEKDSLVRLWLAQPVLKVDLEHCVCVISEEAMAEVLDAQLEWLGLDNGIITQSEIATTYELGLGEPEQQT